LPVHAQHTQFNRIAGCVLQVFGQVAVQTAAPTEAKVGVAQTLMSMQAKYPEQMTPLLAQLSQEQQQALQMLVSSPAT
jgi:hypothetical protein